MVMVGLPACGKSYISKKLINYFNWLGFQVCFPLHAPAGRSFAIAPLAWHRLTRNPWWLQARVFNVGNRRRKEVATDQSADFFAADNQCAKQLRDKLAFDVLVEALDWLSMDSNR